MLRFLFRILLLLHIFVLSSCSLQPSGADEALQKIISLNDNDLVQLLAAEQIVKSEDFASTALLSQAEKVQINIAELLIDSGARVNSRNPTKQTPLMLAAMYGRDFLVAYLLLKGADMSLEDSSGQTAEKLAKGNQHDRVLSVLWYAMLLNSPNNSMTVNDLLHSACSNGSTSAVIFLLDKGADVNSKLPNSPDSIPLLQAAMFSNQDTVRVLLERGADVNASNTKSETALYAAVMSPSYEEKRDAYMGTLRLLVRKKQDVNKTVKCLGFDDNALSAAVGLNRVEAVELLLNSGADPNFIFPNGHTVLQRAILKGNRQMIQLLIGHGANPNQTGPSKNETTP